MSDPLPRILAIVGPTASGKTTLSLQLAATLPVEIISADSRQIYRFLDIGTAKPGREERKRVPHHMIDILEPSDEFSAGEFGKQAREIIGEILKKGRIPLLVGGSGLYVRATIDGLFEEGGKDPELRKTLEERYEREGSDALHRILANVDPVSASRIPPHRKRRLVRALEVYYVTGKPLSAHHSEQTPHREFDAVQLGIRWERSTLYRRIDGRVDEMMNEGFLEEVSDLRGRGFDLRYNALNTVGYKELIEHLDGVRELGASVELIKRNSRRFAKRQMTWFRADKRIQWVDAEDWARLRQSAEEIGRSLLEG